jgi:undecaprenyl-diphosphatase
VSYLQAIVIGLLQGITELFPVSSLGHSVLLPAWLGWDSLVGGQAADESFYLAFLVGLHVATGLALLLYYRRDWAAIIGGFGRSLRRGSFRTRDPDGHLAWMLVAGTIPVGAVGLLFEHQLRVLFARPLAAAVFLTLNGLLLLGGEVILQRSARLARSVPARSVGSAVAAGGRHIDDLSLGESVRIGSAQILALFAGISRSGVTMVAGLWRGLDHEHAARFSFMLATPVILAAGLYKLPDLLGPNGDGVRGQVLACSIVAGVAAYGAVRFLERFFRTSTLVPFAAYCLVVGGLSILRFG